VAFLLDFDGVIVDSVGFKTRAFAEVYAGAGPDQLAAILEYQRLHGGITRRDKFAHFERQVFGRAADAAALDRLAAAYRSRVYEAVLACPLIAGAHAFLETAHPRVDLHLVSGTPHDELVDIVQRRGLCRYFRTVQGAPPSKREAFAAILGQGYDPARTLAVGDAPTEQLAAHALGVPFLGIVAAGARNPFPAGIPVRPTLEHLPRLLGIA
jgi:phosphoglycolate phosphatase-like HAD superfamily hydrolase